MQPYTTVCLTHLSTCMSDRALQPYTTVCLHLSTCMCNRATQSYTTVCLTHLSTCMSDRAMQPYTTVCLTATLTSWACCWTQRCAISGGPTKPATPPPCWPPCPTSRTKTTVTSSAASSLPATSMLALNRLVKQTREEINNGTLTQQLQVVLWCFTMKNNVHIGYTCRYLKCS